MTLKVYGWGLVLKVKTSLPGVCGKIGKWALHEWWDQGSQRSVVKTDEWLTDQSIWWFSGICGLSIGSWSEQREWQIVGSDCVCYSDIPNRAVTSLWRYHGHAVWCFSIGSQRTRQFLDWWNASSYQGTLEFVNEDRMAWWMATWAKFKKVHESTEVQLTDMVVWVWLGILCDCDLEYHRLMLPCILKWHYGRLD